MQFLTEKLSPSEIAGRMKCSIPNITKKIRPLLLSGWVIDLKTRPKTYALTDEGKRQLNLFLMYDDKAHRSASKFYDLHAIEVSFEISDKGNLPKGNVKLKNWSYYAEKFGDFSIKVTYGKVNRLIIYPPHIKADSVIETYSKLGFTIAEIVAMIQARYKCAVKLETQRIQKRPEVHAPLDPLGKVFEAQELSIKGQNIKIDQSGHAHFDIIGERSFENYDKMIGIFPQFMEVVEEFGKQLNVHIPSVAALGTGAQELSAQVKRFNEGVSELIQTVKGLPEKLTPRIDDLGHKTSESLIHAETLDTIESFVAEDRGILREYPALNAHAKIWLPKAVADLLIKQGRAKLC
jgi:DNA-binding MarR family transcriptional regulator